jgi:hypothetical protein
VEEAAVSVALLLIAFCAPAWKEGKERMEIENYQVIIFK